MSSSDNDSESDLHIDWAEPHGYQILRKIALSRNSIVFEGTRLSDHSSCAIKVLRRTDHTKVSRQVRVLQRLRGGPNITRLLDPIKDTENETFGLVLEFVNNQDFRALYPRFKDADVRYYLHELLKALEYTHSMGIMHRDIRPHNIVIDHPHKKLRLVGWGSAEFYRPNAHYSVRISPFKPPELLLDNQKYDCSIDMWGFGAMMASMIFHKEPFFHGNSRSDQLYKIAKILGTRELYQYVAKYDIDMDNEDIERLGSLPRRPWTSFVNMENEETANAEAIDLLDGVLRYDHQDRLTAAEARNHPYFQ